MAADSGANAGGNPKALTHSTQALLQLTAAPVFTPACFAPSFCAEAAAARARRSVTNTSTTVAAMNAAET